MDLLSRVVAWLSDHEAAISAVAAIIVIGGVVLTGLRLLVRRPGKDSTETAASGSAEPASALEASAPDLDPLTVPGFEGRPAIAVLPFDNLSGDPEQEYFADGIAEDLITRLSAWRDFPVIARNSSFTYKGKPVDVKQVSRELGVRYVVEGSVRKTGDRVRITAQLVDATTGGHVWAERYDQEQKDIFAIQDEITTAIAGAMGAKLALAEQERAVQRQPETFTAYDLLMRGRWCFYRGWVEGTPQLVEGQARSLFERSIEIDSRFAAAFAWLALTYIAEWFNPTTPPTQALEEAERAARRSVLLDPELPVGHYAVSFVHQIRGELGEAFAAARLAIDLDPSFSFAHRHLGFCLAEAGEPDQAIASLEKGMRVSPRDPWLSEFIRGKSHAHFAAGRYREAAECAKQSIALGAPLFMAWFALAASQAHLGEVAEATASLRKGEVRTDGKLTASVFGRMFSYWHPDLLERYLEGLRKAGLKE